MAPLRRLRSLMRRLYGSLFPMTTYEIGTGSRVYSTGSVVNLQKNRAAISIGCNSYSQAQLLVFPHGGCIRIGDGCSIGVNTRIWSGVSITLGNRVLISHDVNIFDNQTHPLSARERHDHVKAIFSTGHPSSINLGERAIVIEDDVWIGCMCIILRGVHIGRGAVVSAGSVVTKDVPAWTVVAGNPARIVKHLPEEELPWG